MPSANVTQSAAISCGGSTSRISAAACCRAWGSRVRSACSPSVELTRSWMAAASVQKSEPADEDDEDEEDDGDDEDDGDADDSSSPEPLQAVSRTPAAATATPVRHAGRSRRMRTRLAAGEVPGRTHG